MRQIHISLKLFVAALFLVVGLTVWYGVLASSKDDIRYPVAELGGCANEQACRAYCEEFDRINECLAFAQRHNLLSAEELAEARKFAQLGIEFGPGGCKGEESCQTYCEDISHIQECLAFAEQHDIMSEEELEEARKVEKALSEGAQLPGGCQSKAQCEAYCEDPNHMRECLAFAEQAGFIPPDELEEAKKVLRALESGAQLPGGCRGKDECEAYCSEPSHAEECFEFAAAAGFMDPEEIEQARKILPLMARGEMPGGCRSRQECEAYCSQDGHMEECINAFTSVGIISSEDAEMFRKTGGKGPGDCRGKEECEAFCNDAANQKVCFEFAKEHGMIPEEELEHMQEGMQQFRQGFSNAPPEVAQCLKERIGEEVLAKIEAGTFLPNQELGEHMRSCFEEFMPMPQGEFGPGHEGGFRPGQEGGFGPSPEASSCVQRILAGQSGPPTPELEQRIRQECFPQAPEGFQQGAPQHVENPEGVPQKFQQQYQDQFQQQFQQEYQRQFEQQYQQQYQEEYQRQLEQQSSGGFQPPEGFQAPPASQLPRESFLGAVWEAMKPALERLISR